MRDYISEAEALTDMLDDMGDEGLHFSLPPRPTGSTVILKVQTLSIYEAAKRAKVGENCTCPVCRGPFVKKSYQQAFCSNKGKNNCKDLFWNRVKPERSERAKQFSRRS